MAPDSTFDRLAAGYDFMDSLQNNNDWFLARMPRHRGRALDIGCGSGIVAEALARHFGEVVGIDISEPMLEFARARRCPANVTYLNVDANNIELAGPFDYIVSRTTFHHIEDVPPVLHRLKSLMAAGGAIAILDCVCEVETLSTARNVAGAVVEFARDLFRFSPSVALRIARFRLSRPWLEHLAADRYLSESRIREVFGGSLPGCEIAHEKCFIGIYYTG